MTGKHLQTQNKIDETNIFIHVIYDIKFSNLSKWCAWLSIIHSIVCDWIDLFEVFAFAHTENICLSVLLIYNQNTAKYYKYQLNIEKGETKVNTENKTWIIIY